MPRGLEFWRVYARKGPHYLVIDLKDQRFARIILTIDNNIEIKKQNLRDAGEEKMKPILVAMIVAAVIAVTMQIIVPYPYGLVFSIIVPVIIIWRTLQKEYVNPYSLRDFKKTDSKIDEKQTNEDYKKLEKRFLDGKISKEEFDRLKKGFDEEEK